ncbi:hypothetical protein APTSU1_000044400 [Apodemus speciosus]|uniref:Uncharacterized protein n=1 Tax=Apodemus speciosus TaxID=105296 RepID=A0ABQ0EDJ6_APOSI
MWVLRIEPRSSAIATLNFENVWYTSIADTSTSGSNPYKTCVLYLKTPEDKGMCWSCIQHGHQKTCLSEPGA